MNTQRKVIRRLKRRQVELADELDRRLRRAAKNAAAVVVANAADKRVINNAKRRAAVYASMQREFAEAAGKGQEALNKAMESVAYGSHTLAVEDIHSRPGKVVMGSWVKFDPKRVERYLELINPENGQDLFAVSFGKMANESTRRMRSAFIDVYRQGQIEGWTLQTTAKKMQQAWDGIAGDLGSYRFTDIAGRAWSNADYLNMVARTTLARVHRESYMDTLTEYGDDLVRIKNTGENCPICDAWDGIIISISGKDKRYPSYTAARGGGMFHPNCDCLTDGLVAAIDGDEIARQAGQVNVKWTDPEEVQRYNDEIKVKEKMAGGMPEEKARIELKRNKIKTQAERAFFGGYTDHDDPREENIVHAINKIPDSVLERMEKIPKFEYSKKGEPAAFYIPRGRGSVHMDRDEQSWGGNEVVFHHEFGHHIARDFGIVSGRGVQKSWDEALAADLEHIRKSGIEGVKFDEMKYGSGGLRDVSATLKEKYGMATKNKTNMRALGVLDTVGGITRGSHGGGHLQGYYRHGNHSQNEAFANIWAARMMRFDEYRLYFPSASGYMMNI